MPTSPFQVPLLDHGFRPFFLAAGLWAPLSLALWLAGLAGLVEPATILPLAAWHPHELLFGYAGAAVAGFLLTAIPNWTGRAPLRGPRLLGLVMLWLAARLGGLAGGWAMPWLAVGLGLGFWIVLAATAAREVILGRNWRNLPLVGLVGMLGLGCLLSYLEVLDYGTGPLGRRLGLATLLVLIGLVGGRVIPGFTRNWLVRQGTQRLPAPFGRVDRVAMSLLVSATLAWLVVGESTTSGLLLAAAGIGTLVRLARWQGLTTFAEPLVAILHVGYAWLGAGLLLHGLGIVFPNSIGQLATLHALTAGAVGTMTLAVMTRATLGHTGRSLAADRCTSVLYLLVIAGAAVRVVAPVLPLVYPIGLVVAASLWGGGFVLLVWRYGPYLVGPRVARPG